jgi:hypothetical protein
VNKDRLNRNSAHRDGRAVRGALAFLVAGTFAGLLLAAAPAARADQRQGALGANGELYLTEIGTYGGLFAGTQPPAGLTAASEVLALDILTPGGSRQRVLVPNADGSALESTPALLYEDDTKTLFALWATRLSSLNSVLYLTSFDGSGWSPAIRITGNPFASKASPRLAVTRDSYLDTTVTPPVTRNRTVLHVAWAEADANGLLEVYYTPLIFEGGAFLGFDAATIQNLNRMETGTPTNLAVSSDLVSALNLQSGRDGRTVVASFASVTTGRLVTLEIDVLPRELSLIADQVRTQIDTIGPKYYPSNMAYLATFVATGVMAIGQDFHPEILQPIANKVHDMILAGAGMPLLNLGDSVRAQIIDLGYKLSGRGLILAQSAAPAMLQAGPSSSSSLQLAGPGDAGPPSTASSSQWLQFRIDSNRPVPAVGGSTGLNILASQTGANALVEWQQDSTHLVYTTSQDTGWSDPHTIELSSQLTIDQALAYLQQHLR